MFIVKKQNMTDRNQVFKGQNLTDVNQLRFLVDKYKLLFQRLIL